MTDNLYKMQINQYKHTIKNMEAFIYATVTGKEFIA